MLKQPLLHFLAIGLILFLSYHWLTRDAVPDADPRTIQIDRDALLTYLQYRSRAFNSEHFSSQLDAMSTEERQRLIDDLVREEVLYREALSLQLDRNDYVIKRRLIQKLEFLTRGFIDAGSELDDGEIRAYYAQHRDDYYVEPFVTFTHVFFDYQRHSREQALALAQQTLEQLNRDGISFSDGIQYGDRFLYHANYVERTREFIASHFGMPLAERIFELAVSDTRWQGPFESVHGLHLIMLSRSEPGRFPEPEEIFDRLREDAELEHVRVRTEQAIAEITAGYHVRVVTD